MSLVFVCTPAILPAVMDAHAFLERLKVSRHYRGQIAAARCLEARPAEYGEPTARLPDALCGLLRNEGIERLYCHQAESYDAICGGRDVVICTGTASGKSLCYHLPVLAELIEKPDARALYLFPAKALAYDQLGNLQRMVEDGAGGLVEETIKMPVWFYPVASSGTPMCEALRQSQAILQDWISAHQESFPPMVINITDGEATDGDPVPVAEHLKQLATHDGNVLLFNLHLSSHAGPSVQYPDSEVGLLDEFAVQLFRMSSVLPPHIQAAVAAGGYTINPQARGFVFNAGIVEVIKFLNTGTQSDLR